MTQVADQTIHLSNYSLLEESAANGHAWLRDLRRGAMARFEEVGFPNSKKNEEWRHTNVSPIAKIPFRLGQQRADSTTRTIQSNFAFGEGQTAAELVFVNGQFVQELSQLDKLPRGVTIQSLDQALTNDGEGIKPKLGRYADIEKNPFVALNTGFIRDGAYIHIARSVAIDRPIHLLFISQPGHEPTVSHPRVLFVAEDNVEATIVESYVGGEGTQYFTNAVTEIVCGRDCRIDHAKLQQESLDAYHIATMQVELGASTTFVSHAATIGAKLSRNDLNCTMAGEHAYATLNGVVLIGGTQHCDNHTLLDHAVPNCPSHELYKHVLAGKATGVFRGKILVRKDAQKTDSKQNSKTLLLSDDANMNSQPALEIYADDVKCTHGSTIGPLDEEMIFYFRSRGISYEAARHLLTYAFAADVTRRIKVEPVRRRLEDYMARQHGLPQDLRITDLGAHDEAVL
jgi:Fe-S cluster assembly protein SufD